MTEQWHLAELNIGRIAAPLDDPRMADFTNNLELINGLADRSPGFVWRLVDEGTDDATNLRPFGEDTIVNLSVWQTPKDLQAYMYRTEHLEFLRRRREWFVPLGDAHSVGWWVPAGHRPDLAEAWDRLKKLRADGPSSEAFTLRAPIPR